MLEKIICFIFFANIYIQNVAIIYPYSVCLNKGGCSCQFDPTVDPNYSANYDLAIFGDVCTYPYMAPGVKAERYTDYFACSNPSNCYCGEFAQFQEGNKYCFRNTFKKNKYVNEDFAELSNKVEANQETLTQKIQEMIQNKKYGSKIKAAQTNYLCIYPTEIELAEDSDIVYFVYYVRLDNQQVVKVKYYWKFSKNQMRCVQYKQQEILI